MAEWILYLMLDSPHACSAICLFLEPFFTYSENRNSGTSILDLTSNNILNLK
jgi:hypothetical protein